MIKENVKINKKKGMTFNEFLGLIIALTLLFFLIIYPGSKIYASFSKQQYVNSYNKLVATIEDIVNTELEEDSTTLMIDDNEKILFFNKNAKEIIIENEGVTFNNLFHIYPRPDQCSLEKDCICLCLKCKKEEIRDPGEYYAQQLFSGISNCKEEDVTFIISESKFKEKEYAIDRGYVISAKGGFFIGKGKGSKSRTVYIEKKNNKLGVCFQKPCIKEK